MSVPVRALHPDERWPRIRRRQPETPQPNPKALYRIPEAMRLLSLSRSVIYNQIRSGRLRSVKEGSSRLIPADAIADYIALLEAEAEASR
jgi:excisionase family DNA binding protein